MFLSQTFPRIRLFYALVYNVKFIQFHGGRIEDDSKARNVEVYKNISTQQVEKKSQRCQRLCKCSFQHQL